MFLAKQDNLRAVFSIEKMTKRGFFDKIM